VIFKKQKNKIFHFPAKSFSKELKENKGRMDENMREQVGIHQNID
jgi:hypothetical protein